MAIENDRITADVVEISEFPDLAQRYAVTAVPKIVLNDQMELMGSQPESTFVKAVVEMGGESG
jgi:predicted DsbA family dithiol-disulfide isomerase